MHLRIALDAVVVSLILAASAAATSGQTATPIPPATSDPQAVGLAAKAYTTLAGLASIQDVTLTGSASRTAGEGAETGTVVLEALATGEMRMDLSFASGKAGEVRTRPAAGPVGNWFGTDGTLHTTAYHNLLAGDAWFFPAIILRSFSVDQSFILTSAGTETRGGLSVDHLSVYKKYSPPQGLTAQLAAHLTTLYQHLTHTDLYLDSSTLLPVEFAFNIHPDNDARTDVSVLVRFSEYTMVQGVQVPLHVQELLNNSLILDLHLKTAALNTGLSAGSFVTQ
jgi:hypothetical protein